MAFLDLLEKHLGLDSHEKTAEKMIELQKKYWPEAKRPFQPIDIDIYLVNVGNTTAMLMELNNMRVKMFSSLENHLCCLLMFQVWCYQVLNYFVHYYQKIL